MAKRPLNFDVDSIDLNDYLEMVPDIFSNDELLEKEEEDTKYVSSSTFYESVKDRKTGIWRQAGELFFDEER